MCMCKTTFNVKVSTSVWNACLSKRMGYGLWKNEDELLCKNMLQFPRYAAKWKPGNTVYAYQITICHFWKNIYIHSFTRIILVTSDTEVQQVSFGIFLYNLNSEQFTEMKVENVPDKSRDKHINLYISNKTLTT